MNPQANKFWVCVWVEKEGGPTKRSNHINERSCKQKAKDMSAKFGGYANWARVVNNKVEFKEVWFNGKKESEATGSGEHVSYDFEDPVQKAMEADGVEKPKTPTAKRKLPKPDDKPAPAKTEEPAAPAAKKAPVAKEPAKEPAKPAVVPSAKRKPVMKKAEDIVEQFQPRTGTLREKIITVLAKNIDKPVSIVDLQTAVYGEYKDQYMPAIKMVLKGVRVMIDLHALPYELEHGKHAGELAYTLKVK